MHCIYIVHCSIYVKNVLPRCPVQCTTQSFFWKLKDLREVDTYCTVLFNEHFLSSVFQGTAGANDRKMGVKVNLKRKLQVEIRAICTAFRWGNFVKAMR